jgi:amino acid adenylation domain-containing protein
LLFTSGSTGEPKGVAVSQQNVRSYVEYASERYQVNEHDRCSQSFDLSFDLSAHDMFVSWERGACLCVIPESSAMAPAKFIKDQQLTMWFSVPSVVGVMSKLGMLKPGVFPSLRCSLFCGEPLPISYAQAWATAAPNSIVENVYGPTETTIAITHYRWERTAPPECATGIVPIGWPFDGQRACVIDSERRPVPPGERGELCLAGSQVTAGYWNNPTKTAEQFVTLPEMGDGLWYRTGDLARQDADGCFHYLGRIDHQVKIRGYRVELQEVEGALRGATGAEQVIAVAWPIRDGIADGIVAFMCGGRERDVRRILQACRETLPDYMIPSALHFVDELPLNIHAKVDRLALIQRLAESRA